MSYRQLVNRSAVYQSQLRNREIENRGVRVTVRYRLSNTVNEFGDPEPPVSLLPDREGGRQFGDDSETPVTEGMLWCIPNFESQRTRVNEYGFSFEEEPTLEVMFKTTDYVPEEAEIDLPGENLEDGRSTSTRTWIVQSLAQKFTAGENGEEKGEIIENLARCVPKRLHFEERLPEEVPEIVTPSTGGEVVVGTDEEDNLVLVDHGDETPAPIPPEPGLDRSMDAASQTEE